MSPSTGNGTVVCTLAAQQAVQVRQNRTVPECDGRACAYVQRWGAGVLWDSTARESLSLRPHTHTHTHTHTYTPTHTHKHTHSYTHTRTYTHAHTYTHTPCHTHTGRRLLWAQHLCCVLRYQLPCDADHAHRRPVLQWLLCCNVSVVLCVSGWGTGAGAGACTLSPATNLDRYPPCMPLPHTLPARQTQPGLHCPSNRAVSGQCRGGCRW